MLYRGVVQAFCINSFLFSGLAIHFVTDHGARLDDNSDKWGLIGVCALSGCLPVRSAGGKAQTTHCVFVVRFAPGNVASVRNAAF